VSDSFAKTLLFCAFAVQIAGCAVLLSGEFDTLVTSIAFGAVLSAGVVEVTLALWARKKVGVDNV